MQIIDKGLRWFKTWLIHAEKKNTDWRNSFLFFILRVGFICLGAYVIFEFSYFILEFLSDHSGYDFFTNSKITDPKNLAIALFSTGTFVATVWALQAYWRLRYIDMMSAEWIPSTKKKKQNEPSYGEKQNESNDEEEQNESNDEEEPINPFSFHELAESHKEWAQLWFAWCIAISLAQI